MRSLEPVDARPPHCRAVRDPHPCNRDRLSSRRRRPQTNLPIPLSGQGNMEAHCVGRPPRSRRLARTSCDHLHWRVRTALASIRFLFVAPSLCLRLPSDPPVTRGALAVQLTLPRVGCVEDLHLRVSAPCRAHEKRPATEVAGRGHAGAGGGALSLQRVSVQCKF
jgi:hypothetical protein